ncbi:MAG TPA: BatD family protein [Balneolaceae bacterium]
MNQLQMRMRRIGRFFHLAGFLAMLPVLLSGQAFGQSSISVNASVSETAIYFGEYVKLSVSVSGDFSNVSRPDLPEFEGFRLLSNIPSTSRSYRFINGKSSTSYTYSYSLIAQEEGNYKIPPVNITIDGKQYETDAIDVKVVSRNTSSADESSRPDIFLELQLSDKNPVIGQQVIADVVLYFKDGIEVNSYQPVPGWKAQGFWKEELELPGRPQAQSTIIDGVRYRKARLLKFALFPTKAGTLQVSPYEIIVAVRSEPSRSPFSSFFGGFGSNQRRIELETEAIELQVESLPPIEGAEYIGAVGHFDITRNISTKNAVAGETIEITTRIEGTGNIPLLPKPQYELPEGLEVYEPQMNTNLNRRDEVISGTKVFTDILIARSPGSYSIPAKEVAYFDPSENQYITETLPALNFEVKRNLDAIATVESPAALDINPVMGLANWVSPQSTRLLSYWWFWAGIALPLLILGVGYWQKTYRHKMVNNQGFARSQKASGKAAERLDEAVLLSEKGEIKQAYNMLQKAITGFISDRLSLSQAGLSNDDYIKALEQQNIDKNLVKNVHMLLEKCASISYAPSTSHEYLKSHVGLAQSTLDKLKKVL